MTLIELHSFWFGDIQLTEEYYQEKIPQWFFGQNHDFDQHCRSLTQSVDATEITSTPRKRLAKIILLDQLYRNAFRDSRDAHAGDSEALNLCLEAITAGDEQFLALPERIFLYMPLEHSEDPFHQDLSVEKFRQLHTEAPDGIKFWTRLGLTKALEHQEVIRRFGRFPGRNKKMGRLSTPLEEKYLSEH